MKWATIPLSLWLSWGAQPPSAPGWRCHAKPVEPCFKHHGRLSSQNGIAFKIWLIGTTRVVGLEGTEFPPIVEKYLEMTSPDHSFIYGDFDICPTEYDRPGVLRRVCVTGAEKLVVQKLNGSRPPFRLLATWPKREEPQVKDARRP